MDKFYTSPEFIKELVNLAYQCFSVGGTGCTCRTPKIDGNCLDVDFHFKMIIEDKK